MRNGKEKELKKFLTNEKAYDNINKLVAEKQPNSFEKVKKVLDKEKGF